MEVISNYTVFTMSYACRLRGMDLEEKDFTSAMIDYVSNASSDIKGNPIIMYKGVKKQIIRKGFEYSIDDKKSDNLFPASVAITCRIHECDYLKVMPHEADVECNCEYRDIKFKYFINGQNLQIVGITDKYDLNRLIAMFTNSVIEAIGNNIPIEVYDMNVILFDVKFYIIFDAKKKLLNLSGIKFVLENKLPKLTIDVGNIELCETKTIKLSFKLMEKNAKPSSKNNSGVYSTIQIFNGGKVLALGKSGENIIEFTMTLFKWIFKYYYDTCIVDRPVEDIHM